MEVSKPSVESAATARGVDLEPGEMATWPTPLAAN